MNRQEIVDQATANMKLSGGETSPWYAYQMWLYVQGIVSADELVQRTQERHGIKLDQG